MKPLCSILIFGFLFIFITSVLAQSDAQGADTNATSQYAPSGEAIPKDKSERELIEQELEKQSQQDPDDTMRSYVYEKPTLEKFSQLYWALGKLDTKKDEYIDNFLMINECDIYRDYYHNEFEWRGIRKAGGEFLEANKNKFSLRFEFIQPLKLGEYDSSRGTFEIVDEYKIKAIRRFEIYADNYEANVCGYDPSGTIKNIEGYPRALLVELSRPVMLSSLEVEPALAKAYVESKLKKFKNLRADLQNNANMYDLRDAYLVMKVKFFSYRQDARTKAGLTIAEVLGILEGIEIYADRNKKILLYQEDYRQNQKGSKHHTGKEQKSGIEDIPLGILADPPPTFPATQAPKEATPP